MTTKKQMCAALTQITEAWLDEGVDPQDVRDVLDAKSEEMHETIFRSLEAHVRQYQVWLKREEDDGPV